MEAQEITTNEVESNLEKKKMIFYPHFNLGDLVNIYGAIKYYSKEYKITLVILKENTIDAKSIFSSIPDILFYPIDKIVYYPNNKDFYDYVNHMYDITKFVGNHINLSKNTSDPLSFYDDLALDRSLFNHKIEHKSQNYVSQLKGIDYVFISMKTRDYKHSFNYNSHKLFICPDANMYEKSHPYYLISNNYVDLPYLEYMEIMECANEIYVVDNDFFYLSLKCNLNTKILNCICLNNMNHTNLTKEYKYEMARTPMSINISNESPYVNGINRNTILQKISRR